MSYKELDLTISTRPEAEANMKLHIEALRELAQAFVKEVEDLGTEQPVVPSSDLSFYDEVRRFEINQFPGPDSHRRTAKTRRAIAWG